MSTRRSAGVIFWGLVLVTIGVLMLAHNLGYPLHIWPYIARYWPALLIAWGLLKFVDFFRFRRSGDNRPLFSGGEVALLILVIFAGSAITTAANVSPDLGNIFQIGDLDLWDITGNNFSYDEHKEVALPSASVPVEYEVDIVNYFGNVEVRPSDMDHIVLDAKKTVRAASQSEADRLVNDFTFSITNEGSKYRIASSKDTGGSSDGGGRQAFKSSLEIQLPKHFAVHVDNRNGRVAIQDLIGSEEILNRFGDVEIHNIAGRLKIENRNGAVTAEDISDSVAINNAYSNTTVKNIGGDLELDSKNASVDISNVKGNAKVTNAYAPVNVDNVQGNLTINGRNNSLDIQHVGGDIAADSSYENVNITDPRGAVRITGRNGEMTLSFERPPEKDVNISAQYGTVTLDLPASSAFSIEARADYGEIESDFDGLNHDNTNRQRLVRGEVGHGGPKILIETRNGNIRLVKRGRGNVL